MAALAAHRAARKGGNLRKKCSNWGLGTGWMKLAATERPVGHGVAALSLQLLN